MLCDILIVIEFVEAEKIKAGQSRDQSDRADHAKATLIYALSSGSLDLYRDTLMWTRRFVRDPVSFPAFNTGKINLYS